MTCTASTAEDPSPKPSTVLLVAVAAVSPLGITMYLPSMPGMARALGVDLTTIQLTLSLYLTALALGQLIIGPLSDRFGRRPALLVGLGVFVVGSFICFAAQDVGVLIFGRVVQALGGCAGIVLSRAIVRDLYGHKEAASVIGYVAMGMAVAPMIAPSLGGALDGYFGWRASFAFLMVFGGVTFFVVGWKLYETNHKEGSADSARGLVRNYAYLFRSRLFRGYTLACSFNNATYYAFLAGAPYVMIELMGRTPAEYGLYFAVVPSGNIIGSFATGRLAVRIGPNRLILSGLFLVLASTGVMAATFAKGLFHPMALFTPMFFIGLGSGLIMPNGIAGAVGVKPELAGSAAGLSGSLQIGFGAIVAPIVGTILDSSVWPLIATMIVSSLLALASFGPVMAWRRSP